MTQNVMESLATIEVTEENLSKLNESDCAICKDAFELNEHYHMLPCKHYFHCDCIKPWLDMVISKYVYVWRCYDTSIVLCSAVVLTVVFLVLSLTAQHLSSVPLTFDVGGRERCEGKSSGGSTIYRRQ